MMTTNLKKQPNRDVVKAHTQIKSTIPQIVMRDVVFHSPHGTVKAIREHLYGEMRLLNTFHNLT